MKKLIMLIGVVALLVTTSCQKEVIPETEFLPKTESVSAVAEGGEYYIEYTLTNPVEGLSVSASTEDNWIDDIDCSESGVVSFTVLPIDTESQREGKVVVEYGDLSFSVPVIQAGDPYASCDVDIECSQFNALYYGDAYETYTHFFVMSDLPMADNGSFDPAGIYYVVYLTRNIDEETATAAFTNGTYNVDPENTYADWTISTEHSYVICKNTQLRIASGTLTVSGTDLDNSVFDILFTMEDGTVHHAVYSGPQYGDDYSIDWVDHDVDMTAETAVATWLEADPDVNNANINITLYSALTPDGWVEVPGYALIMVGNVEYDQTGHIVPGTYPISDESMLENAFQTGSCVSFMNSPFPSGTNIRYFYVDNTQQMVGLVKSGNVTISGSGNDYTVECDFVTREGKTIHASYTGALDVKDNPYEDKYSQYYLTEDHELTFPAETDNYFRISCFSSTWQYEDAVSWTFNFNQYNENYQYEGDQFGIEIVCPAEYTEEPMEGTYKVAATAGEVGTVSPGTFLPKDNNTGTFIPSYFRYNENGTTKFGAAAKGGELTLTKNDDGTWTISFDFTDQQEEPKHFTCNWTGNIKFGW